MFTACRHAQTSFTTMKYAFSIWRCLALIALAMGMIACSEPAPAPIAEPWVTEGESLHVAVNAGGIPTAFTAYFSDEQQLTKIVETRKSAGNPQGEYSFTGARLTGYTGAAIGSGESIEFSLDMKGAVSSTTRASDTDISALRTRAQLLRSLALARRTTAVHAEPAAPAKSTHQ
jgi:hypothetical protein